MAKSAKKKRTPLTSQQKAEAQAKARETRAKRTPAENAAIRKRRVKKLAERDEAKLQAILDSTPKQSKRMSTEAKLAQIRAEVAAEKKATTEKRSKASKLAAKTRKAKKEAAAARDKKATDRKRTAAAQLLATRLRSADYNRAVDILLELIDEFPSPTP